MDSSVKFLEELVTRFPALSKCKNEIERVYLALAECYKKGGKVLIAGNGGSAADADHIVGELMKGFLRRRELPEEIKRIIASSHPELGPNMAEKLQGALPAVALTAQSAIMTAFSNDVDADLVYAQQVLGYGRKGDVFIGISTSGNSKNVVYAACLSKALGLTVIGLTGAFGGKLKEFCDITIQVPERETAKVQELHLPVYHTLCAMVEAEFFS